MFIYEPTAKPVSGDRRPHFGPFPRCCLLHGTTMHLIPPQKWTQSGIAAHPPRVLQLALVQNIELHAFTAFSFTPTLKEKGQNFNRFIFIHPSPLEEGIEARQDSMTTCLQNLDSSSLRHRWSFQNS
ncbi:MAG: hypothetical protein Q9M31_08615 [Mariprofundus sp.]|nr:hypothetical protein [Mariprofundus sp.]